MVADYLMKGRIVVTCETFSFQQKDERSVMVRNDAERKFHSQIVAGIYVEIVADCTHVFIRGYVALKGL